MIKVPSSDYPAIIQIFNDEGKKAAYEYIRSQYGVSYPDRIILKIKRAPGYKYDPEAHQILEAHEIESDKLFMSLDELCTPMNVKAANDGSGPPAASDDAMDRLVRSLISDRLLELSKYITLDTMNRTIMIDRSSMFADGYKVLIHG